MSPSPLRLEGVQYATEEEGRAITELQSEEPGPKQKWHSAADASGGESKVQCCKENTA